MNAYSIDLRLRVLSAVDASTARREVAQTFGVSLSTIERLVRARREQGHVTPKSRPGLARHIGPAQHADLEALLRAQPDATLEAHALTWEQHGRRVSASTLCRALQRAGWTRKKSRCAPARETSGCG